MLFLIPAPLSQPKSKATQWGVGMPLPYRRRALGLGPRLCEQASLVDAEAIYEFFLGVVMSLEKVVPANGQGMHQQ